MPAWTQDELFLFLLFFVPGFVSIKIYDLLVPAECRRESGDAVGCAHDLALDDHAEDHPACDGALLSMDDGRSGVARPAMAPPLGHDAEGSEPQ